MNKLRSVLSGKSLDSLYEGLIGVGGFTAGRRKFGIGFILGNEPNAKDVAWLQIVLRMSSECMQELDAIDPLAGEG